MALLKYPVIHSLTRHTTETNSITYWGSSPALSHQNVRSNHLATVHVKNYFIKDGSTFSDHK